MNEQNISSRILPTSATMVGVCMTVISVHRLIESSKQVMQGIGVIEILLAGDTLFFLFSALLSYLSMRTKRDPERIEQIADMGFLLGLVLMVIAAFMLAFQMTCSVGMCVAFGVQGLAPYWFNVDAAAYLGEEGRSALWLDTEYELLLTQKLILQPRTTGGDISQINLSQRGY